ncbi:HVO_0476 family zinc finger protein [Euryarchaeota archaeon]|nr:HVO_0476 family zinc finger protein [Euryarchaeota archaeon]
MDDTDVEEEVVDVTVCPKCSKMTEHEILRRTMKGNGEDLLVRCIECSNVQNLQLRPPKSVSVKTTLSDRMDSRLALVEADEDELISRDDYFAHEEQTYKVTRIEDSTSKESRKLEASKISAMWAVRVDRTIVPITMTEGERSVASSIECDPERVFSCGTIMKMDGRRWRIRALHTGKGRTLNGKRLANEIRRIYLHVPEDDKENYNPRY